MNLERISVGIPGVDKNGFKCEVLCCLNNLIEDEGMETKSYGINEQNPETEFRNRLNFIIRNIESHALKKNFIKAERIRNKLYEFAPKAIKEIYESGLIIETEKNKIYNNRLKRILTNEEYVALKNSLINKTFQTETALIQKSEKNFRLFFINEGLISISAAVGEASESSILLKPGGVVGVDTFFSLKKAKESVFASPGTNVDYLNGRDFSKLVASFPAIKKKLYKFCMKSVNDKKTMTLRDYDRRAHDRFKVAGVARVQLMDSRMMPSGDSIRGQLIDISRGGLSFGFKTDQPEPDKAMKGKPASVVLEPAGMKQKSALTWDGIISGVRKIGVNEYTVHFRGEIMNKAISVFLSKLKNKKQDKSR